MNKVLVTGATGKSGSCFLKELQASPLENIHFGFAVRSREKGNIVRKYMPTCNIHIGDLTDKSFLTSVFARGGTTPYCIFPGLNYRLFLFA